MLWRSLPRLGGLANQVRTLSSSPMNPVISANTRIQHTTSPKTKLPNEQLLFGNSFSDHMLEIDWNSATGWKDPVISPYHSLQLDPACSSLHYALQLFEGMKAYRAHDHSIRLFRPDLNMRRMQTSAQRLHFPAFDETQVLETIKQLVRLDQDWIPQGDGYSLYIRPTMISTHPFLGVGPAKSVKLFALLSPVGPYYPEGFSAVKLFADSTAVRAWPGGSGDTKIGANYGPTVSPAMSAAGRGYTQVLWLLGEEGWVTEAGTMNQFVFWVDKHGERELVTAPLDGTILPGVTRDSILQLARAWGEFRVSERAFSMREVADAVHEGRMLEAFGAGTAAIVSPVKAICWNDEELVIPLDPEDGTSEAGVLTKRLAQTIMDIQYGKVDHEWSVRI